MAKAKETPKPKTSKKKTAKTADKKTAKPADKAAVKPVKKTTAKSAKKAVEKPVKKTAAKPVAANSIKTDEPRYEVHYCSFCGKPSGALRYMIKGPNSICICEECVEKCARIFYRNAPIKWENVLLQIVEDSKNRK